MKTGTLIAAILTLTSISAIAVEQRGAKAIFVDTTSGAIVEGSKPQPSAKPQTQHKRRVTPAATAPGAPEAVGLKYYIELVSPSGQRSLVTADRTFRSGERILLHVESNVDGDIEVYQREPDGRQTRLFPDERVNGGSALIAKNSDTILPSPNAWFRFDDQAGTEHLTVIFTPRLPGAAPWRPAPPVQSAANAPMQPAAGSKGLLVETDNTSPEPATYTVRRVENGRPSQPLSVPIALKHQ